MLDYLFENSAVPCLEAIDADDSGTLDISDPIFLLNYLFLGGPRPSEPFADCGVDPTTDGLGCAESCAG